MRRLAVFLTTIVFLITVLISGCSSVADGNKITVVCTTFSVYDWVNEIIAGEYAENFDVVLLGGSGDMHSYQPTAQDIARIKTCNLFIYVGGVSDGWTKDVLDSKASTLRLFDHLDGELLCTEHGHGEQGCEDEEYDEHIWLSPVMAQKVFNVVFDKVSELLPDGKLAFETNRKECEEKFVKLDEGYRTVVSGAANKTVVFADRFPFAYLMRDYGIECVAAFTGCSADQDAGFEVIARLAETVDKHKKKTVLVLENSNQSVAETVIESTTNKDAEIAVMNSFQTISVQDIEDGADYFDIMEENLEALKKALE